MKKFFIKISKFFGFEIIDQNEFTAPTLNKELNEDLSILNKKQSKIIIAGIAALKRDALITWVWIKDKYVKELNKPTLVNPKKNNNGKLSKIVSLYLIISL